MRYVGHYLITFVLLQTGCVPVQAIESTTLEKPKDVAAAAAVKRWLAELSAPVRERRCVAAIALKEFGQQAREAIPILVKTFERAGQDSDFGELGCYLELLRSLGPAANAASEPIARLLQENAALYANREKAVVMRLRSYMLITLADIGVPDSALPAIADYLANSDSGMLRPYCAALRAAGTMGARAKDLVPYILKALDPDFHDMTVFLKHPFGIPADDEGSSVQIEALRALGRIGPAAQSARRALARMMSADEHDGASKPQIIRDEARAAWGKINARQP